MALKPSTDGPLDAGADGGICFTGDQPPTGDVTNTFPSDPPGMTSISETIDITTIAPDAADDNDYDDAYPGGATPTLGVPVDG